MKRLKKLGFALVAVVALSGLISAGAWASGAPENTVKPRILGGEEVGAKQSVSTGTWTNSPTSYAYQWQRCNPTGGECADIAGATTKNYVWLESDNGHTLVAKVTAFNAAGEGSAFSPPSLELSFPEISPNPTEKEPLSFTGSGRFEFVISGFIICESSISGKFVNSQTAKGVRINYSSCSNPGSNPPFSTELLEGKLGYVNAATKTVGLELRPENSASTIWATNFLTHGEKIEGDVFGGIGPTGKKATSFTLTYAESEGHQAIRGFGGGTSQLWWSGYPNHTALINLIATPTLTMSRSVEIKTP